VQMLEFKVEIRQQEKHRKMANYDDKFSSLDGAQNKIVQFSMAFTSIG